MMQTSTLEAFKTTLKECYCKFNELNFLKYYILVRKYEFNTEIIDINRISLESTAKELISIFNTNDKKKLRDRVHKTTDDCYEEWPICIYDYDTFSNVVDVFVYKVGTPIIFIEDYFESFSQHQNNPSIMKSNNNYKNILIERKLHVCIKDKRKVKSKIPSGFSVNLHKINEIDYDEIMNNSTGTGDKSFDKISNKSLNQENEFDNIDNKSNHNEDDVSLYDKTKKKYKNRKQNNRIASLANYSLEVMTFKEDNDFQSFISKINNKYNMLSQANSFYLRNFDFKSFQKESNYIP